MGFFSAMNSSASGMTAQRLRMDTIAENIANANTTRTKTGGPYKRKTVVFEAKEGTTPFAQVLSEKSKVFNQNNGGGVEVTAILEDNSGFDRVYEPGHPDADKDGYVLKPKINTVEEMVNMMSATRAYEANVTALNASKSMALKAIDIGNK